MQKKLNECEIGGRYVVTGVQVDESITRRLEALGVNEGTPVNILNKKGSGSVIIKVRGTRLALGKRLSEGITVRRNRHHERTRKSRWDGYVRQCDSGRQRGEEDGFPKSA